MLIKILNKQLSGSLFAISSKSMAHRHLICASLADKPTRIHLPDRPDDVLKTIDCLKALGAIIESDADSLIVSPLALSSVLNHTKSMQIPILNTGESGTTLRFMLPVATTLCEKVHFIGEGRLPERPIEDLTQLLTANGCQFSGEKLPFTTHGKWSTDVITLSGNVSSQYISGILLAAPLHKAAIQINIIGNLESRPYVDMTIQVMKNYGVDVIKTAQSYFVKPQRYTSPKRVQVEGDWSNAAFFLVAGALLSIPTGSIKIAGLNLNSLQGDRQILKILEVFGAKLAINQSAQTITVKPGRLKGNAIDCSQIPDLLPIVAVLAAGAIGTSTFYNAARTRLKESDRLHSTAQMINNLGGKAIEKDDALIIEGAGQLTSGTVFSYNDHRIAMATAITSIICKQPITLKNATVVKKSYTHFYEDFIKLGGQLCHL